MAEHWIASVGIDIGTSTSKWIMSRLKLAKISGGVSMPRYEIVERRLDYVSPILETPLKHTTEINVPLLLEWLEREYERAGIVPEMIQSGAIIITGETATKSNAEQIVHTIAERSGQFVVATAGADLESLLAGKGSGAEDYSRKRRGVVANIDIGGGTANAACFRDGTMIATVTLHVGGRLIRLEKSGRVQYVAQPLRRWAERNANVTVPKEGETAGFAELQELSRCMAGALIDYICSQEKPACPKTIEPLLVAPPSVPLPPPDEIWISGGVGGLMGLPPPCNIEEAARFGDIGPLLAAAIREKASASSVPIREADQSERATVIGTGTHTTEISGATLYYDITALPLRNVPVAVCRLPASSGDEAADRRLLDEEIKKTIGFASGVYGSHSADPPFALVLKSGGYCSYRRLQLLADAIASGYSAAVHSDTLAVICEDDMAKALGYALKKRLPRGMRLISIDQISPAEGDYLDIGTPLQEDLVPVVIKTLVFLK